MHVILPARTGGMDWIRKRYWYAFLTFQEDRCEFKSVWVSTHFASKFWFQI